MTHSLLEKIKVDADVAVAKIATDAATAVAAIEAATQAELSALETATAAELEKQKAHQALVSASKSKQERNIALQAAKRDAIETIFAAAFAELASQPAAVYVDRYTKLWQASVPKDSTVVAVAGPEMRTAETTAVLQALAVAFTPTTSPTIQAGLVVTTEDGVYDLTLDRQFADLRPELEMKIVQAVN